MLPARHRLRASADFTAVVRGSGGVRAGGRLLVLHARRAPDSAAERPARVGFVVSKAVGGAVTRNRTVRVLRHLVARRLERIPGGVDVVVRANPDAARASTPELGRDLDRGLDTVLRRLEPATPAGSAGGRTALQVLG